MCKKGNSPISRRFRRRSSRGPVNAIAELHAPMGEPLAHGRRRRDVILVGSSSFRYLVGTHRSVVAHFDFHKSTALGVGEQARRGTAAATAVQSVHTSSILRRFWTARSDVRSFEDHVLGRRHE